MKIIYLSLSKLENSVNSVYIKGLKANHVEMVSFFSKKKGLPRFREILSFYQKNRKNTDVIMVGYESPELVILTKLFSRKKIIYNALCSTYERIVVARELVPKYSLKSFYYWLTDFLAVHLASLTMVETNQQIAYFQKLFKVSSRKLFRAFTGTDEDNFSYNADLSKFNKFTVIFRGSLMPEAGAEYVIEAAKILEKEKVDFIMVSGGFLLNKIIKLIEKRKPANLRLISQRLSYQELNSLMQGSHLSLGQFSKHQRLQRTIPHKAYESIALKLPYLTATNKGIIELLKSDYTCITCNPADASSLANKIKWTIKNYPEAVKIAENAYELYNRQLRPKILAEKLLKKIVVET